MATKTMETDSIEQRFKRIRADLNRIQQTGQWPVAQVYERDGDGHFSIRIVSPFPPEEDSE